MAGERHGRGMGTAWARHGVCESALSLSLYLSLSLSLSFPQEIPFVYSPPPPHHYVLYILNVNFDMNAFSFGVMRWHSWLRH
jgi:hypothetical protein